MSPYEQNVEALEQIVRQTIRRLKREGVTGMSRDNLKQVVSTRGLSFPNPYAFNVAFSEVCDRLAIRDRLAVRGFAIY